MANKEKTPVSAEEFKTTLEGKEFNVIDANSQLSSISQIKQAYLAIENGYNYQIEFYELEDDSSATTFYNNNKNNFEASKGSASSNTNIAGKNYEKYTLSSNGKYMVVSRIANTVIYLSVKDEYSSTVKDILKEIDY